MLGSIIRWSRHSAWLVVGVFAAVPEARVPETQPAAVTMRVASPNGRNEVTVELRDGALTYGLRRDARVVLLPSKLGFALRNAAPLGAGLRIVDTARASTDETWTQPSP